MRRRNIPYRLMDMGLGLSLSIVSPLVVQLSRPFQRNDYLTRLKQHGWLSHGYRFVVSPPSFYRFTASDSNPRYALMVGNCDGPHMQPVYKPVSCKRPRQFLIRDIPSVFWICSPGELPNVGASAHNHLYLALNPKLQSGSPEP